MELRALRVTRKSYIMEKQEIIMSLLALVLNDKEVNQATKDTQSHLSLMGETVIIRARNAGVHIGELVSHEDGFITLKDSNRIWNWEGSFTLSDVSQNGISKGRVGVTVPTLHIPIMDIGEILSTTKKSQNEIRSNI